MQAVFEVHLAFPLDDVCEQVPEESRVFGQQGFEIEGPFGRDQLVKPDLAWRQLRPRAQARVVFGVRSSVADSLEDHPA